jgi:hypothetical protein
MGARNSISSAEPIKKRCYRILGFQAGPVSENKTYQDLARLRLLPECQTAHQVTKFSLFAALVLEQELQYELDQPWIHRADRDLAKVPGRGILGRESRIVYRVKRELRVVEGVEEFAPELQGFGFPNLDQFRERHIPVVLPRGEVCAEADVSVHTRRGACGRVVAGRSR